MRIVFSYFFLFLLDVIRRSPSLSSIAIHGFLLNVINLTTVKDSNQWEALTTPYKINCSKSQVSSHLNIFAMTVTSWLYENNHRVKKQTTSHCHHFALLPLIFCSQSSQPPSGPFTHTPPYLIAWSADNLSLTSSASVIKVKQTVKQDGNSAAVDSTSSTY